jgi:DNA-binding NarL/FixJ family response regulator
MTNAQSPPATIKVLIIDDDDAFRRSTARILARHGYLCIEASSGDEALDVLDVDKDVTLVLCDVTMPGTSGIELLAELFSRFPDVAVVMITGLDDPRVASEAFDLGALAYVTKPFAANELLISLAGALRRHDLEAVHRARIDALEVMVAEASEGDLAPDLEADEAECIRVLIVDDHAIFTQSLLRLLQSKPRLEVVGTSGSVASAVAASIELRPDVVLMDFELPDGDGPAATVRIKASRPDVQVVMLTARTDDAALVRAVASGCSGFVNKADTTERLFAAIVAAYEGEAIVGASSLAPLLGQLLPTHRGLGSDLTPRELEVLRLMASGLINKQVARSLGLRLNTVRNHSQSILLKLEAHSRLEAVATAVRDGIIDYPSNTVVA